MNAHQRRKSLRQESRVFGAKPLHIKEWIELAELPESETHRLEIDVERCNGWIHRKDGNESMGLYLSTHTFYGSNHKKSTRLLRQCGFNITLANWDAAKQTKP